MASAAASHASFPTTHWTQVHAVQHGAEGDAAKAMEELCRDYWFPIYAYLRQQGHGAHDAEDLTQLFFQQLLTGEDLLRAREDTGRLRSYLLGVLKRLVSDDARRAGTLKRGGGVPHLSLDISEDAEERYAVEFQEDWTPELLFERAWAHGLLAKVREKLRTSYALGARAEHFGLLLPYLMLGQEPPSYRELGIQIGSSEAAARILIHRLRVKFGDLLREEVTLTVLKPEEIAGEMAWLRSVLSGS